MTAQGPLGKKMVKLTVRVRARDSHDGKPISDQLVSLYKSHGISGVTILQGVRGYGKHGVSRADVLGLSMNVPLIIETIDEEEKVSGVLEGVRGIVGSNGLTTVEYVDVL